jgi:hypothetical protein
MSNDDRDDLAVRIAEALWPERYVGDLSVRDWKRVYAMVDAQARVASDEGER